MSVSPLALRSERSESSGPAMGNALLGKSTYVVQLADGLSDAQRAAVIALDLIREKQSRNS